MSNIIFYLSLLIVLRSDGSLRIPRCHHNILTSIFTENTKILNHSRFCIMPTAYILVNCTLGSEEKIIAEIAKLPDISEVRGTYGVHDVFVKVKSESTEAMNHTVTNKIRKIPGITSTVTLVVIDEQGGKESL